MLMPLSDVVGPSSMPVAKNKTGEKEVGLPPRRASGRTAPVEEVLDQNDTPTLASPPSWDEMMDMLKLVSCFTDAELPSTKKFDFFFLTKRISVNLGDDPLVFILARLPIGTSEYVVSRIQ